MSRDGLVKANSRGRAADGAMGRVKKYAYKIGAATLMTHCERRSCDVGEVGGTGDCDMKRTVVVIGVLAALATAALAQGKGSTGKSGVVISPGSGQGTVPTPKPANPTPPGKQ